jgi:hypothetical protein
MSVRYAHHAISIDHEVDQLGGPDQDVWLIRESGLARAKCWCGWRSGLLLTADAEQAGRIHREATR